MRLEAALKLAALGERAEAEALVAGMDTPEWRALALSALIGELDRGRAPERWAGPSRELP